LNHFSIASFLERGKYSIATVSLYQNGEIDEGKNSHHSQVFCIFSIILGTNSSYCSFVYCLLNIQ
jgi:hypothetical protein